MKIPKFRHFVLSTALTISFSAAAATAETPNGSASEAEAEPTNEVVTSDAMQENLSATKELVKKMASNKGTELPDSLAAKRINWLHTFNGAAQLSQAYISNNWYQGGNNYLSFLFSLLWNVELNKEYHPNLLFNSSFQYNLGINTTPKGSLHKFNTSQDLLQYNLTAGLRAFNKHWFYTLTALFNTQLLDAYPDDSMQRSSAFLSPGTFNVGVGMTYSLVNENKTFDFTASLSPLAYNLKTCIFNDIDHEQFNIPQDKKTKSEIGSSGEIHMIWKITNNISWKSRLFVFTDYSYFLADWENTFNFQLNKYLSTQLYLYPRFDSSAWHPDSKWNHWMFKEILSFGISYTFTNKPK